MSDELFCRICRKEECPGRCCACHIVWPLLPSLLSSIAKVKLARKCTVKWKITYLFLLFLLIFWFFHSRYYLKILLVQIVSQVFLSVVSPSGFATLLCLYPSTGLPWGICKLMFRFEHNPINSSVPTGEAAFWFVKSQIFIVKLRSPMKEQKYSTYELHRIQLLISLCSVVYCDMKSISH